MKIVTFQQAEHAPRVGALLATGEILDFANSTVDLPQPDDDFGWFDRDSNSLNAGFDLIARLDDARMEELRSAGALVQRADVKLCAPIPRPRKVICIGLNYRDHAEESGMDIPKAPLFFSKFSSCVIGPDEDVIIPPGSTETDYECEMGIVIGRKASRVAVEDAYDYVLGYVNVNDVSARDFQFADGQWQRGKSCDTFCPMGEFIATTDEIEDPHKLRISLRLNGETMQDSSTEQLIFGVPEIVSYLSQYITLEPGDLIPTGTPPGVGFARKPPVYIKPGDVMEVDIEGLGVLRNPVRE